MFTLGYSLWPSWNHENHSVKFGGDMRHAVEFIAMMAVLYKVYVGIADIHMKKSTGHWAPSPISCIPVNLCNNL